MKMEKFLTKKSIIRTLLALLIVVAFVSCKQDIEIWKPESDQQVISDYVANTAKDTALEKYSEFAKLLDTTRISSLLSIRGPFTLFLPTNDAIAIYCKEKNLNSILDLDSTAQKNLVYNHIISTEIQTGDIGLGAIREVNGLGDKIVSEFSEDFKDIILNKKSIITKRDIKAANGYIHQINRIIEPVTVKMFDLIKSNPSYSLFAQGLELTGLKDTLQLVDFPYGKKFARTNFTILAVPDTIFNRYGINTIDDLVNYFTDDPSTVTSLDNGFYRYIEYHCMGGTYYLSDFSSKLYPIFSYDNNISMTIDAVDYKINYNKVDKTYTGFIVKESNIPAKNGALHTINDLLPIIEPDPVPITFEVTDYLDIKQGDYYGKYYKKWFNGQTDLENIKWEGDYLQYYYKDPAKSQNNLNWDCLNMSGYWWIEITTPKIMKGDYALSGFIWDGQASYACYVDGVQTATIQNAGGDGLPVLGDVHWTKTETHKIKLVALSFGLLFWDTITLTPLN